MNTRRLSWSAAAALALLAPGVPRHAVVAAEPIDPLGVKLASSEIATVTDRTLGSYFGDLVSVSETHAGDCGATMRVSSGALKLSGAILALRRVSDCAGPKPVLALRFTVDETGADAVRAAMRRSLGTPTLDGPGAMGAPTLLWCDPQRVVGVVQDVPPGRAFSVFFVNQDRGGSSDPDAEQGG